MKLKSIKQVKNLKNKTVLLRVDYNVTMKQGKILDMERIERSFATLNFLLEKKAKVVIMTHFGRPQGKKNKKYSLKPIVKYLNKITQKHVQFVDDCVGTKVQKKVKQLKVGQILLLENLRFYPGEKDNDVKFAQELAGLADLYVNEGFAVCHRVHASVAAITNYLPSYAGLNLIKEVDNLSKLLKGYQKPAIAIIGGVKISTKINVIERLAKKYRYVLIGGALANNFLKAQNINVGSSIYEEDYLKLAKDLLKKYSDKIILPMDVKVVDKIKPKQKFKNINIYQLNNLKNKNWHIIDIGLKTELFFEGYIKGANTVVWNGPMGVFEIDKFDHGTDFIAKAVGMQGKGPAFCAVGGGETLTVLEELGIKKWFDFVSTGGGAMLEFLEGKALPGIKPLKK